MDIRVKCCLLYLVILGLFTHVTSQGATSATLVADTIRPAETSKVQATDAREHATTGVPSKLAVPVTVGGKDPAFHAVTQTTPGAIGGKEAHSLHPSPDSTTGAAGGKEIHTITAGGKEVYTTAAGGKEVYTTAAGGKEVHTIAADGKEVHTTAAGGKEVHTTAAGGKEVHTITADRKEVHTTAADGKEVHLTHRFHDTTLGIVERKEIPDPQPIAPGAGLGPVGAKEARTIHPTHDTTLAHVKVQRPKHLISRMFHPPTVDPVVLQNDYIILCVCGPGIVFWLIVLVIVTIRRKRKGRVPKRNFQTPA